MASSRLRANGAEQFEPLSSIRLGGAKVNLRAARVGSASTAAEFP